MEGTGTRFPRADPEFPGVFYLLLDMSITFLPGFFFLGFGAFRLTGPDTRGVSDLIKGGSHSLCRESSSLSWHFIDPPLSLREVHWLLRILTWPFGPQLLIPPERVIRS